MSQFEVHGDPSQEADRAERPEDVSSATDVGPENVRGPNVADQARPSDLVADLTLAQGVTYLPGGLRVLRTSYVFRVNEAVRGNVAGEYVTVNDTGGMYSDGSSVSTENSHKLRSGGRYLIFADRVGDDYWLRQVMEVHDDGEVVADASGRVLVGIQEGVPLAEQRPTYESLRYVRALTPPEEGPMEGPPEEASAPLPEPPEARRVDTARQAPMNVRTLVEYLRTAESRGVRPDDVLPATRDEGGASDASRSARQPPDKTEGGSSQSESRRASEGPSTRAVLSGAHVTAFQSHFHFMPDDNNWAWTTHCRSSWNALVNNNLGLFAFKIRTSDNQPIRDRLPVADNNQNNVGVLSNDQMTAGGYDTWPVLSANGVCYTWVDSNNRVRETDILMNPAIAGNEAQFRKSLTHEFGHAVTLDHETARMALLYPGTFRQPPNYGSLWYSRRDDHRGIRSMLEWVNANIAAGSWNIAQFTDVATWSQAHDNPGTAGNLVMTRLSKETVNRGETVTVHSVHLENRGTVPAQNVSLKFYLSTNETISSGDHEVGSFTWTTLSNWWSGSLNVQIPNSIPSGQYFFGWIVTTDSAERSTSNNTAILMRDHTAQFARVRVTVN
jgi:hypothetical protein